MQFFNMKTERQDGAPTELVHSEYQEVRAPARLEHPAVRTSNAPMTAVTPLPVAAPASAPPAAAPAPSSETVISTIISADITIEGNVTAEQGVCLEGKIQGDLRGKSVVIGREGSVTGSIVANEVAVYGRVLGSIQGKNVMLYKSAHVEGDVLHQGIGIEMGSHYDGRLKWDGAQAEAAPAESAPVDQREALPGEPSRRGPWRNDASCWGWGSPAGRRRSD
jgi:cytoskeletal protein CcmA (bactofilin family)